MTRGQPFLLLFLAVTSPASDASPAQQAALAQEASLTQEASPSQEASSQAATPTPAALDPAFVVGAPKGQPLSGATLATRTHEVASLLRCPVCQGLSVADSPASMASNMKAEVRALLERGYSDDQALAYFERSYGEFVRLKPPLRGVNWLVWLGPLAGLLAGGLVVALALRKSKESEAATSSPGSLPGRDTLPDDPKLAAAVLQVRELAYGWPGGKAPGEPAR